MPGPPPPPPPGGPPPMMPPPPMNKASSDGRSALLQSIEQGAKLKKTVTNDKSAPALGKQTNNNNSTSSTLNSGGGGSSPYKSGGNGGSSTVPNGVALGGLFAGGMPKLKPTGSGKQLGITRNSSIEDSSNSSNREPDAQPSKSFNSIQNELKKQMANDSKSYNRGPPPPAPVRNLNVSMDDSSSRTSFSMKNGGSSPNGFHQNPSLPNLASPAPQVYHRKSNSNVNISTTDSSDFGYNNNSSPRTSINHGKPNLAPKPPMNVRPAVPPPAKPDIPPPPPPTKLTRAPSQNPPLPPNNPPPPPPHSKPQVPSRPPPAVPSTNSAPPPPPRVSSTNKNHSVSAVVTDLEKKFAFHQPSEFPKPIPFRNLTKVYTSRQESKC